MDNDKIYVVYGVGVHKYTEADLRRKYEQVKEKFRTFEEYMEYLKDFRMDEYDVYNRIVMMTTDKHYAEEYIKYNGGDIYESGYYPYSALLEVLDGESYGIFIADSPDVYKLNVETMRYEKVDDRTHLITLIEDDVRERG